MAKDNSEPLPVRGQILAEASRLTLGDRNDDYGPPIENMTTTAELINAYLRGLGLDAKLTAEDVAHIMVLVKIARSLHRYKLDNAVDAAAYAAIGAECREQLDNGWTPGADD